jgi:hypothetical protein
MVLTAFVLLTLAVFSLTVVVVRLTQATRSLSKNIIYLMGNDMVLARAYNRARVDVDGLVVKVAELAPAEGVGVN